MKLRSGDLYFDPRFKHYVILHSSLPSWGEDKVDTCVGVILKYSNNWGYSPSHAKKYLEEIVSKDSEWVFVCNLSDVLRGISNDT